MHQPLPECCLGSCCMQVQAALFAEELWMELNIVQTSKNIPTSKPAGGDWAQHATLRNVCSLVLGLGWLTSNNHNHVPFYEMWLQTLECFPPWCPLSSIVPVLLIASLGQILPWCQGPSLLLPPQLCGSYMQWMSLVKHKLGISEKVPLDCTANDTFPSLC